MKIKLLLISVITCICSLFFFANNIEVSASELERETYIFEYVESIEFDTSLSIEEVCNVLDTKDKSLFFFLSYEYIIYSNYSYYGDDMHLILYGHDNRTGEKTLIFSNNASTSKQFTGIEYDGGWYTGFDGLLEVNTYCLQCINIEFCLFNTIETKKIVSTEILPGDTNVFFNKQFDFSYFNVFINTGESINAYLYTIDNSLIPTDETEMYIMLQDILSKNQNMTICLGIEGNSIMLYDEIFFMTLNENYIYYANEYAQEEFDLSFNGCNPNLEYIEFYMPISFCSNEFLGMQYLFLSSTPFEQNIIPDVSDTSIVKDMISVISTSFISLLTTLCSGIVLAFDTLVLTESGTLSAFALWTLAFVGIGLVFTIISIIMSKIRG